MDDKRGAMREQRQPAESQEDLIFGGNPVREALRRNRPITRVWVSREKNDRITEEIISNCRKANIPYKAVDKQFLDRLCGGAVHQGFAAQTAPKEYTPWKTMQEMAVEAGQEPLLILLDGVEDPQNLGAILRSAEALGAHGAVITKNRAAPLTSGVARASAGAWEYVMVDRVTNLARTIEDMKKAGFWVTGAAAEAEATIYDLDWSGSVALVLGGENKGLSPLIRQRCDRLASIPMAGQINSLNVSAAAAVILSEINRSRRQMLMEHTLK
ncbi:MAG: 23S rRNA (guanosine(2251)-2'-O)-methyltransferase RlmB [Peptococcaceae bacterium]|nr:23S rRNA (guanosine(2251)-2'-O)-methyltransferase RlmB [Peptococcaceae bacterium]